MTTKTRTPPKPATKTVCQALLIATFCETWQPLLLLPRLRRSGQPMTEVWNTPVQRAKRRLFAHLIAKAHLLDQPFTNAPDQSPWSLVKAAMTTLDQELTQTCRLITEIEHYADVLSRSAGAVPDADVAWKLRNIIKRFGAA